MLTIARRKFTTRPASPARPLRLDLRAAWSGWLRIVHTRLCMD